MFKQSEVMKGLSSGALLVVALLVSMSPAKAAQRAWDLNLETEELQRQFAYKGSSISQVAKIVTTYAPAGESSTEPKKYESVWFHDGKPIGLEKLGPLAINRGDIIYVKVKHKKRSSDEECKAAAFSLMRMALMAYHSANSIITMTVPAESFDKVSRELQNRNCREIPQQSDQSNISQVRFNLESEPEGKQQHLFFETDKTK